MSLYKETMFRVYPVSILARRPALFTEGGSDEILTELFLPAVISRSPSSTWKQDRTKSVPNSCSYFLILLN